MNTRQLLLSASTALFAATVVSCQVGTEPGTVNDLEFTTSLSRTVIPVGGTAVMQMRLRNRGASTVTLNFPHSCQILPYIEGAGGSTVFPTGGGWGCLTVVTRLVLEPGEEVVQTLEVHGGAPAPAVFTGALLPPGQYRAFAELGERPRPYSSTNSVSFSVVE